MKNYYKVDINKRDLEFLTALKTLLDSYNVKTMYTGAEDHHLVIEFESSLYDLEIEAYENKDFTYVTAVSDDMIDGEKRGKYV